MVAKDFKWLWAVFLLLPSIPMVAQNYSSDDTITEYPNKGTYYHDRFEGRKTANGEIFDQNKFTAAHWKIKLGTYVMVTNRNSGLQVIVRVNDRCPKHGVFDLSHRAANAIGIKGMQPVTVRLLQGDWYERWAAQETMFDSVSSRLHPRGKATVETDKTIVKEVEPKPAVASAKQNKSADTKQQPQKNQQTTKPAPSSHTQQRYNLELGPAASHGEALAMIGKLPKIYREKVLIETLEDESLLLTLELKLPKSNADELCRAWRKTFNHIKVTPSE